MLGFVLAAAVVVVILQTQTAKAEWQEPDSGPVNEQFSAPITTGDENQAKSGYLLIDPEFYNPSENYSLTFDPDKPLDVRGEGALFDVPNAYSEIFTADSDTLYVDGIHDWIGIGTKLPTGNYSLQVKGGTVLAGSDSAPISGQALSSYSDIIGVSSQADSGATAALYGYADSTQAAAVKGESKNNVGVRGESIDGYGIQAVSNTYNQAAVYGANYGTGLAGYFDGRLWAGEDIVAKQFLPLGLQQSLIPFTARQKTGSYQITNGVVSSIHGGMTFDGAYIWAGNKYGDEDDHNLFKVRVGDGTVVGAYQTNRSFTELTFDGMSIWGTVVGGGDQLVSKIDPETGEELCTIDTFENLATRQGVDPWALTSSAIDGKIYIWTANYHDLATPTKGGDLTRVDPTDCETGGESITIFPVGEYGSGDSLHRLVSDGGDHVKPMDVIFASDYIWTVLSNVTDTNLIKVDPQAPDPDNAVVARYSTGLVSPDRLIFDGVYLWVLDGDVIIGGRNRSQVAQIRASDGAIIQMYTLYDPIDPANFSSTASNLIFTGTHIWVLGNAGTSTLHTINVATGEVKGYRSALASNYGGNSMLFDGTNVWLLSACKSLNSSCDNPSLKPLRLTRYYSGSGQGHTDQSSLVTLRDVVGSCSIADQECQFDWQCPSGEECLVGNSNIGQCSVTTTQSCIYDSNCPVGETCSTAGSKDAQPGNFNMQGSADIHHYYCSNSGTGEDMYSQQCSIDQDCVDALGAGWECSGGDVRVGQDLKVVNNQWNGDTDTIVDISGGTAACGEGMYLNGIEIDGSGALSKIRCRGL